MISLLLSSSSAAAAPSSSSPSSSSLAVLGSLLESSRVHLHPWIYTVSPLNISHMSTQALQGTIPQPRRPPPLVQLRNPQIQFKFKWYVCGIGFQGTPRRIEGTGDPIAMHGWLAGGIRWVCRMAQTDGNGFIRHCLYTYRRQQGWSWEHLHVSFVAVISCSWRCAQRRWTRIQQ